MRLLHRSAVAAFVLSLGIGNAQAGLLDCLFGPHPQSQTVSFVPVSVEQQNQQQSLIGTIGTIREVLDLIDRFKSGGGVGGGGGGGGSDSAGMQRANDTLDRIDTKVGKLEEAISRRLTKIEGDLQVVAKAQIETSAQIDKKLVETMNDVKAVREAEVATAKQVQTLIGIIKSTQEETDVLIVGLTSKNPSDNSVNKNIEIEVLPFGSAKEKLKDGDHVKVHGAVPGKAEYYVIKANDKIGIIKKSDLTKTP